MLQTKLSEMRNASCTARRDPKHGGNCLANADFFFLRGKTHHEMTSVWVTYIKLARSGYRKHSCTRRQSKTDKQLYFNPVGPLSQPV